MKDSKTDSGNILVLGIGNCGRGDDGLGWKFADRVRPFERLGLHCEYRYQLQVEDVLMVCRYDKVIFADASHSEMKNGFEIKPCTPAQHYFFSSHMQSPETILYLAKELYNKMPEAYTVAIAGKQWGLGSILSREALKNLTNAFRTFKTKFFPNAWESVD